MSLGFKILCRECGKPQGVVQTPAGPFLAAHTVFRVMGENPVCRGSATRVSRRTVVAAHRAAERRFIETEGRVVELQAALANAQQEIRETEAEADAAKIEVTALMLYLAGPMKGNGP